MDAAKKQAALGIFSRAAGGPNFEVIGGVAALGVIGAITASQSGSGSKVAPKVRSRNGRPVWQTCNQLSVIWQS